MWIANTFARCPELGLAFDFFEGLDMKHRLMITTAILACSLAVPALAQDEPNSVVINGQLNLGDVWSSLNVSANNISGGVDGTSAAIGNSFSAELGDHSHVNNVQRTFADIASEVNANISNIDGDVNLTSAAVGNTASVHSHGNVPCPNDPEDCPELRAELELTNKQAVDIDPYSLLNLTASGVGNVNGTSAAIANSLSVNMAGPDNSVSSWQGSGAETTSIVNATINGANSVNLTSAAVANTVSIDQLGD